MSWDLSVLRHRRGFLGAAVGGAAALLYGRRARGAGTASAVTAGEGGDFASLADALAALGPGSPSSGSCVKLLPGVHAVPEGGLALQPYVAIEGCGQGVTEIACAGTGVLRAATGASLSSLTLSGDFTSDDDGPGILVDARVRVLDFRLHRVSMYVTGAHGAAISMTRDNTCFFSDLDIVTTSVGLVLGGICHIDGMRLFLSGMATGTPYYGIYVPDSARVYLWASKIATGYGYASRDGFDPGLQVASDPSAPVIGIYIPATNTADPRVECYGLNSYARNDQAPADVAVHCVRADAGRVRLYGGLQQAERTGAERASLVQSGGGIIETFADRWSGASGDIWGTNTTGTTSTDASDDMRKLTDESGGVVVCDASAGAYTLVLPGTTVQFRNGIRYIFVKVDATTNAVTIDGGARTISGVPARKLTAPYMSLEVIGTETEWLLL